MSDAKVSQVALERMAGHIDQLPMLPQVLVRILQISAEDDNYFDQIETLAKEDPPFAVRLLAMANSASSSPASPVLSIKNALTRVGATTITSLVTSLAVQRVFVPSNPSQVELWQHSLRVAVAAETIAELLPSLKLDNGQAYLGGLLHDIGRFVMFEHAAEDLLKVDESHWHSPDELIEADMEVFKFTHSELGYLACSRWGIPEDLANAVRRHHEKLPASVMQESVEAYTLCIEMADQLETMVLKQQEVEPLTPAKLTQAIDQHCLWSAQIRQLITAQMLAQRIDKILTQSSQLLEGLGLAKSAA